MPTSRVPRVAVIHDWLVVNGGAERVLARILQCYPQAEVFTLVDFLPAAERGFLAGHPVHTSFLQRAPLARRFYRHYLPWMPLAVESFDLSGFDLVISSSYCVAKGVLTGPDQTHVSYVHSPMRYAWDLQHQYLRQHGLEHGVGGFLTRRLLHELRLWDVRTANGVDVFIANSDFIARRIWKIYRRESLVVHPPVDTDYFHPGGGERGDFYLSVSRLVPYKCTRLMVEAFARLPDRQLVVIGDGPELKSLKAIAGPNVKFLGYQPDAVVREHLQRARAYLYAALEDFGIAPVEAMACGTPVIAYGKGGVSESVIDGRCGVLYPEQTSESLAEGIASFERRAARFSSADIRAQALRFSPERFMHQFRDCIEQQLGQHVPTVRAAG
ncbi:MAG: glycosyltransferase family 4 protein [Proteobacteria bacterium]|nr:glycosyltransferase family 4 protein [Pseudomonadota bacterium]